MKTTLCYRYAVETSPDEKKWRRYNAHEMESEALQTAERLQSEKPAMWVRVRKLK